MPTVPHRRLRSAALFLLAGALAAAAGLADGAPPDPNREGLSLSQRFEALLDRIQYEQGRLESLSARFEQERSSEFLADTETSRGTVLFASPDRVRWEYDEPKPISLVIRGDEMVTWYRDLGRAERLRVERLSSQVMQYLSASGSLESLLKYFKASVTFPRDPEAPYEVALEPRFERVARRLAGMSLWIDRELYLPVRVRYEEPNGDVTEYRLLDLEVNGPLPDERFDLELPPDVEVREVDLGKGKGGAASPPG